MAGEQLAFHVTDNGAGFPPEYAGKLFRPFQRLHNQEQCDGHGIGLASVKRIIERHGGMVGAEGRPGQGATFRFTLPREAPAARSEEHTSELQSLMRISYAVFCLKHKNTSIRPYTYNPQHTIQDNNNHLY